MRPIFLRWFGAALLLGACAAPGAGTELLVSAAASLTSAFTEMEEVFESENPEVDVILNLAGSSTLRDQIVEGAPVDVFAAADTITMDAVVAAGYVRGEPQVFARNRMQLVVPAGNPGGVLSIASLADPGLLVGLCAEPVPCGSSAQNVLARADVSASVDTHEPDVRALLTKVEAGELDAAIVYATDALDAAPRVESIDIPAEFNVDVRYPIAVISGGGSPLAAEAFVEFVRGVGGQSILAKYGFAQ